MGLRSGCASYSRHLDRIARQVRTSLGLLPVAGRVSSPTLPRVITLACELPGHFRRTGKSSSTLRPIARDT
jgi:hypothetical protein